MFADLDRAMREMGATDIGVGRHVKAMARGFYGRIAAYERGLAEGDDGARGRAAAQSLRHRPRRIRQQLGAPPAICALRPPPSRPRRSRACSLATCRSRRLRGRRRNGQRRSRRRNSPVPSTPRASTTRTRSIRSPPDDGRARGAWPSASLWCRSVASRRRCGCAASAAASCGFRRSLSAELCRPASSRSSRSRRYRGGFTLLSGRGRRRAKSCSTARPRRSSRSTDGRIDIGEAVAQQLSLALDPFPRAPDAEEATRSRRSGEPRLRGARARARPPRAALRSRSPGNT